MERVGIEIGFPIVSVCLEHSTNAEIEQRVHLHAFLSNKNEQVDLLADGIYKKLCFEGCEVSDWSVTLPSHVRGARTGDEVNQLRSTMQDYNRTLEAHYYAQAEKVGSLHKRSNLPAGEKFIIKNKWIQNLWKQKKLTTQAAVGEVFSGRCGLANFQREAGAISTYEVNLAMAEKERIALAQKVQRQHPFVPLWHEVTLFMAQFTQVPPPDRTKLLVFEGSSQVGKSDFLEHLYGADKTCLVNMQGVTGEPPLQEYAANYNKYKAILFDEVTAEQILNKRMLYQGGCRSQTLGYSNTGCMQYKVNLHQVLMMMSTNDFWSQVKTDADKDYLEKNIIFCRITAPLFISPVTDDSGDA